jgi:hypothetical protein
MLRIDAHACQNASSARCVTSSAMLADLQELPAILKWRGYSDIKGIMSRSWLRIFKRALPA